MTLAVVGRALSDSNLGVEYAIRRTDAGQLLCECKAFQFNRDKPRRCKHTDDFEPVEERQRFPLQHGVNIGTSLLWHCKDFAAELLVPEGRGFRRVKQIGLAGSVRRGMPTIGGVDLVIVPRDVRELVQRLDRFAPAKAASSSIKLEVARLKVTFYLSEPDEYVMNLLWRTGSIESNHALVAGAKKLGRHLTSAGVMEGRKRIAWQTEEEIFEACGLPYKFPKDRGDPQ
jgi:DNA polymerase/3'-5' exonuclease PolX